MVKYIPGRFLCILYLVGPINNAPPYYCYYYDFCCYHCY